MVASGHWAILVAGLGSCCPHVGTGRVIPCCFVCFLVSALLLPVGCLWSMVEGFSLSIIGFMSECLRSLKNFVTYVWTLFKLLVGVSNHSLAILSLRFTISSLTWTVNIFDTSVYMFMQRFWKEKDIYLYILVPVDVCGILVVTVFIGSMKPSVNVWL